MANVVTIEAEVRARSGKGAARATRRAGKVPAVIYGGKQEPNLIALDPRVVIRELHRAGWQSRLYEINAGDDPDPRADPRRAVPSGHRRAGTRRFPAPRRRSSGSRSRCPCTSRMTASAPASSAARVLNVVRHAVEVYCDADHIPEQFTADLGPLDFNDNVRWHDLKGTENVKPVIDRDFVVATVVPPTKIEVVAEAGAAGAPPLPPRRPRAAAEGAGQGARQEGLSQP